MVSVRFLLSKFTLNVGVAKLRQLRVMARVVIVRLPESRHESAFPTAASISQLRSLSVVNVWLVCKSALAKAETSLLRSRQPHRPKVSSVSLWLSTVQMAPEFSLRLQYPKMRELICGMPMSQVAVQGGLIYRKLYVAATAFYRLANCLDVLHH